MGSDALPRQVFIDNDLVWQAGETAISDKAFCQR